MRKDFIKISFHSKLFKGRSNWYFCYLKAEKLAQVFAVLSSRTVSEQAEPLERVATIAAQVVQDVVYAAAGEISEESLLASVFSIMSSIRLLGHRSAVSPDNARLLVEEYESIIEKLVGDSRHLGISLSPEDLIVPSVVEEPLFTPLPPSPVIEENKEIIKDIYKGHSKNNEQHKAETSKGQERAALILDVVRKSNGASIRDIAKVVLGCSEKTIQRELNIMIERGLVVREGERRWSTYRSA